MAATVQEADADTLKLLRNDLAKSFELARNLPLDAELRRAADEMSAAHLSRIDRLLPVWMEEERAVQSADGIKHRATDVYTAVWARLLNELALWQVEPGDPDYEQATLAVLKSAPRICEHTLSNYGEFTRRIIRIQQVPAAQRGNMLAAERQLLARWGQVRTHLAAWPNPLPQETALALIKRPATGDKRTALALPPVLATELLGFGRDYAALHPAAQCALQQWWLQESLRQGTTPATVLNNFRYGTLHFASVRLNGDIGAQAAEQSDTSLAAYYPKFASHFLVTGTTTVRFQLDAAGKALQATVAARNVTVQGIRGQRPIAFENVFDQASINYVRQARQFDKQGGAAPALLQIAWTLPENAASANSTKASNQ